MHNEHEHRGKHHEATQRALEHGLLQQGSLERAIEMGLLSPEQAQMARGALQHRHHAGARHQGGQPAGYPSSPPEMKARPATSHQSHTDALYRNAVAELHRWLGQYEKYRMQGAFAQLEPIFQTITQLPKH